MRRLSKKTARVRPKRQAPRPRPARAGVPEAARLSRRSVQEYPTVLFDLAERKQKEEQLRKLNRVLQALSHSSQAMMRATDESEYLHEVCKILAEDCGHAMVWIGYAEQDANKSVRPVAHAGFEEGYVEKLRITWADTERGRGPTGTAIRTGKPCGCRNMRTDPAFAPWRREALRQGYASSLALPLLAEGRAFGAVNIYFRQPEAFSEDEMKLLSELADDLAHGITSLRLRGAHGRAEAALRKAKEELEQRVRERTAELTRTIEQLQVEAARRDLAERVLHERSKTLEAFFRHSVTPLVFLDRKFNFIRVNDAYARACQRDASEFPGHNHFEFYPHAENQAIFEEVVRSRKPHQVFAKPFTFPDHPEWGVTYWDWTLTPLLDDRGKVESLVFSLEDVTKQTRAAEANQQLAAIVESSSDGIFTRGLDDVILTWNKAAERIYWYAAREAIGQPASMLVPPDRAGETGQIAERIRRGEKIESFETVRVRKDGTPIHLSLSVSPVYGAAGRIVGVSAIARDISDRKRMEERLHAAARYARNLLEASLDPVFTISPEGKITDVNKATEEVTGAPRERLVGSGFADYFTEPGEARRIYRQVLSQGSVRDYPLTIRHASGRTTDVLFHATVFRNEAGEVQGVFAAARDITERKAASAALEQYADQLRRLALELTQVEHRERRRIAEMLHDHLQQILVAAMIRVGMLDRSQDPAVRQAAREVEDLLSQSVEASRTLTGELVPPILHEGGLVAALEWLGRWMEDKHGLRVQVESDGGAGPGSDDVTALLYQAVRELLFNVVKHAGVRTARVEVRRLDGQVQVTVADEGAGFDPGQLAAKEKAAGAFGLFSIRDRLDLLGGRMEVQSQPGRGSRFSLRVPLQSTEAPAPTPPALPQPPPSAGDRAHGAAPAGAGRKVRVLLADDHAVARRGMARLIEEEPDMEVVGEAADGTEAVDLARRLRPDVVVMDVSMPGLGGIDATRILHAEMPDVRVVGLSLFEEIERAAAMRQAGAAHCFSKSAPPERVVAAIRQCARGRIPAEPATRRGPRARPRKTPRGGP